MPISAYQQPDPENPQTGVDMSDVNNIPKLVKASVLAAALMSGKTPAQAKAAFLQAWNSL